MQAVFFSCSSVSGLGVGLPDHADLLAGEGCGAVGVHLLVAHLLPVLFYLL